MKNLAKQGLVVFVLMMSLTISANDIKFTAKVKEEKVTSMILNKVESGSTLRIKDQNGLVLYKEIIEEAGDYSKGFDLTTLPNGDYYFELNSESKIVVIPFNVKASEVLFDKNSKEFIYKPVVRAKDNLVYVSRTELEHTPLSYKVYYSENNDLVHTAEFGEMEEVKKMYDFSSAKKGDYVFVFESNGRKFSKKIKI